jgi:hypothetical protein
MRPSQRQPHNRSFQVARKPGTFAPGQSGNPGGRPKEAAEVKALAREHGAEAIAKLVLLLRDDDKRTALAAAQALLDRGYGKPGQSVELSGAIGQLSHEQWLASLE